MLDDSAGDPRTTVGRLYLMAAETLQTLAVAEPLELNGSADPLRSVLRTAAKACEQFSDLKRKSILAFARVAELESLLANVAESLEAEPLPVDGGSWAVLRASQDIRRALEHSISDGLGEPEETMS